MDCPQLGSRWWEIVSFGQEKSPKDVWNCPAAGPSLGLYRLLARFLLGRIVIPKHLTCHVFAETTHVVAAPHGLALLVTPATYLRTQSFIEICLGVCEPQSTFPVILSIDFYNSL